MKTQKMKRISITALCAIVIISIALSVAMSGGLFSALSSEPSAPSKAEVFEKANEFNEALCEEGIVLLKNANNALPLASGNKVSVFGKNSVNLVRNGSGSSYSDTTSAKTLYESLSSAGFTYNPTLKSFYESTDSGVGRSLYPAMGETGMSLLTGETPQYMYTQAVKNSYSSYNDAAIIVISRIGGEGYDLPQSSSDNSPHYLELDNDEIALIRNVCDVFNKVVVILNIANVMELGFIEDGAYGDIDACLWMGFLGDSGVMALGRVLKGEVNPSGRTVDTWARDLTLDPTWVNFANNGYSDDARYTLNGNNQQYYFVDYEEGVYTGYRYYETRGATDGETWYAENVVYPFGYGLSYTDFSWEIVYAPPENLAISKNGLYTVKVKVTNTGAIAGKDTVQMYCTPPYTTGGIEKSHKVLCGFAKTGIIAPGGSETVTLEFSSYDIASYDYSDANKNGFTGYELDVGDYSLCLQRNAHEVELTIPFIVVIAIKFEHDLATDNIVENRFDDADDQLGTILSRSNWQATLPTARTDSGRAVTQAFIDTLSDTSHNNPNTYAVMPSQGVSGDLKLCDLMGAEYDDEKWDSLLDILSIDEMQDLVNKGAFGTIAIYSIDKPETIETDGPSGFVNFMGDSSIYDTCFYACETVAASTWNTELLYAYGESLGEEALCGNERGDGSHYSAIYAPGVNIHRSPFGGRNFERYSEDGYLSGEMAAAVIRGAQSKDLTMYVKNFALNEQETNRAANGLVTWATEQSIREIYLKPFEMAVKRGGTRGIMTSFNRIGTKWTGGDYRLLTEVLRDEWGFRGTVISDFNITSYMNVKQMIYAGGDLSLAAFIMSFSFDESDPSDVTMLRRATKNILYTVANSNVIFAEYVPIPVPSTDELLRLLSNLTDSLGSFIMTAAGGNVEEITSALDSLVADMSEIEKLYLGSSYIEDFYSDFKDYMPLYVSSIEAIAAEIALCYENADGDLRLFVEGLYEIVQKYLTVLEILMPVTGYDISAVKAVINAVYAEVLIYIDKIYDIIGKPEPEAPTDPIPTVPTNPTPSEPNTDGDENTGCFSAVPAAGMAATVSVIVVAAVLLIITSKNKKQI